MALAMLTAGAVAVVVGAAMLSTAVAVICAGALLMAGALALAAVQDRKAPAKAAE